MLSKKIIFYGLLIFLGLSIFSILLEVLLGIVFLNKDRNIEPEKIKDYPYLYFLFDNQQGDYNEHGFKTKYSISKAENTFRIVLIGGSVARGKKPEESIAAYLEQEMKENFPQSKNIEVVNAGVSAFVLEQEFILTQLIIQYYQPDMIIGLDGYNDLLSYSYNAFHLSDFALPPHHWNEFQAVKKKSFERKWYSRFALPFKNINRAKDFLIKKKKTAAALNRMQNKKRQEQAAKTYFNILADIHDFCSAKNIFYYSFLQPIKFYGNSTVKSDREQQYAKEFYQQLDTQCSTTSYCYSLTQVFESKKYFTDDCHLTPAGNKIIALAIYTTLQNKFLAHLKEFKEERE